MNTVTKLLFAALLAVSAPVWADQAADLQGKWHCLTRYDDINAETRDHIHFSANGTVKTQGKMIFKFNLPRISLQPALSRHLAVTRQSADLKTDGRQITAQTPRRHPQSDCQR